MLLSICTNVEIFMWSGSKKAGLLTLHYYWLLIALWHVYITPLGVSGNCAVNINVTPPSYVPAYKSDARIEGRIPGPCLHLSIEIEFV
jgi:hypothetical protein